ncbi:hypothetical protein DMUE_0850 [Dictyocoela muelleri]|nr:hypothetical protein DMUE_0850 [Dictyocoela muelleri]
MNFEILKSQKGKRKLIYKGYIYNEQKKLANYVYWRCVRRECGGRIHTDIKVSAILKTELHWHEVKKDKIVKLKANNSLKMSIDKNQKIFDDAFLEFTQDVTPEYLKFLGTRNNFRDYFIKRTNETFKNVQSDKMEILETFKYTFDQNLFLQFDNKDYDNRIIIFFDDEN